MYPVLQGLGFGLGTDLPAPRLDELLQPASMPESGTAEHTSGQRSTGAPGDQLFPAKRLRQYPPVFGMH
jgi:hypothetical protein